MTGPDTALPRWRDPRWRAGALAWLDAALEDAGRPRTGAAVELRSVPWSTVLSVPTGAGDVWFKANARGVVQEAGLVQALARWVPDRVLHPIAVDVAQGWLLLPDGGQTLREAQAGHSDLAHWERILVEYADLQRGLTPYVEDMLRLGVPDNRPEALAGLRRDLLGDDDALLLGRPGGMTPAERDRQLADSDAYAVLCAQLEATGIGPSLQHDDLHDNNVFVPADETRPYRIFDWGDAVVSHPFATLLVSLRVVAATSDLAPGAPELRRLRDAYLEPWTAEHDRADLREAALLAVRVGGVGRAACYRRALLEATPAGWAEFGDAVSGWLAEVYEPTPLDPARWLAGSD